MSTKPTAPEYFIKIASEEIYETPYEMPLIAIPCIDTSEEALVTAISAWGKLLSDEREMARIVSDDIFKKRDKWFGFGVLIGDKILDEKAIFSIADSKSKAVVRATEQFIVALTDYNKTFLNGEGLYTHEERETGTFAILWLMLCDISFITLYIDFLKTLDLDHTVAQIDVLFQLAKKYGPSDLHALKKFVEENHVQLLMDWTLNDRLWKS